MPVALWRRVGFRAEKMGRRAFSSKIGIQKVKDSTWTSQVKHKMSGGRPTSHLVRTPWEIGNEGRKK